MAEQSQVRRVETREERDALYRFRYRVYVEDLGMTTQADHERKQLYDEFDEQSISFAIFNENGIVRSLRCTYLEDLDNPQPLIDKFAMRPAIEAFGISGVGTTSRFTLAPELRSTNAVYRLIRMAYAEGLERGARLNYGDCSPTSFRSTSNWDIGATPTDSMTACLATSCPF